MQACPRPSNRLLLYRHKFKTMSEWFYLAFICLDLKGIFFVCVSISTDLDKIVLGFFFSISFHFQVILSARIESQSCWYPRLGGKAFRAENRQHEVSSILATEGLFNIFNSQAIRHHIEKSIGKYLLLLVELTFIIQFPVNLLGRNSFKYILSALMSVNYKYSVSLVFCRRFFFL